MEASPSTIDIVIRACIAVLGAGALGWQREMYGKPAGLRTQMMVALGASLFTMVTLTLHREGIDAGLEEGPDPLRVIQGIVTGIGFLGAGTIIESRGSVKGMTTAATIWVVGGYGIACGLGYYVIAATGVVLALAVLSAVGKLEDRFISHSERSASNGD
jgi:putative Mg2+ transporter-C (MgtC) family protein